MKDGPDIARIASLIGDPARANMLAALMGGRALTATELAGEAGVTPATASAHLSQLEGGSLLRHRKQGRHKYFEIADEKVAAALEALMALGAQTGQLRTRPGPKDPALRTARVCYNHLAGERGIRLYDSLVARDFLAVSGDGLTLSDAGKAAITSFGIDLEPLTKSRSPLCRECIDWSERRSHLAGSLGRAMLTRIETLGWARRVDGTRIIRFTPDGERQFARAFPV